jgi:hypothetical protein
MHDVLNKDAPGNGAMASLSRAGCLRRVMPEQQRWVE